MMVLAVETATTVCSAALVDDGQVIAERTIDELYVHTERLLGLIDEAMIAGECSLNEIEGLAVSIGPGSFTGLRIGLSIAKGLSYALDKPIAAVPTLEALAETMVERDAVPEGHCILPLIDARRDEVYVQLFRRDRNTVVPVWEPQDLRVSTLVSMIGNDVAIVTGNGREKFREALSHNPTVGSDVRFAPDNSASCTASSVGRIGEKMLRAGAASDRGALEPMYIKHFHTIAKKVTG
jgi:tRNA threonylcarbamoyladenosine biosynthesis protein TsaB